MIVTIEYVLTPHLNNNNNIGCGTQHMCIQYSGAFQKLDLFGHFDCQSSDFEW